MKKIMIYSLSVLMLIGLVHSNIKANEFAGHEDEYTSMCEDSSSLSKSDLEVCQAYSDYLRSKNSYISDDIALAQQQMQNAVASQSAATKQLAQTETKIQSVQQELKVLNEQIKQLNLSVQTKKELLRDRMYILQTYMNGNELLNLLLSSGSLDDFLTRVQCIDELTKYDQDLLVGLQKDLKDVEEKTQEATKRYDDLFALQTQQSILVTSLNSAIEGFQDYISVQNQLMANYRDEIGYIDDSLSDADKRLQAQKEREEEANKSTTESSSTQKEPEKTTETAKPADTTKPAETTKPTETTKTEEVKPVETKPVETKPAESKPKDPEPAPAPTPTYTGNQGIVNTAYSKLGCEYVYGGTGPNTFDCSGFAQWVYRQNGIYIPRTVTPQYWGCELVDTPQPGDLLFFNTYTFLGHVGIYVGNGMFIHAGTESTGVCLANMYSSYWQNCYQGAGRYY